MTAEQTALAHPGLTSADVAARVERGEVNRAEAQSQSVRQILRRNTFTWLNLLLVSLGAATLATGSAPDATFLIIAVVNTVVGAVQEVRAKRTLDSLSVVNALQARVWRDGTLVEIPVEELVLDDVVELSPGDQVAADSVVVADEAEVDESLITGESDAVPKQAGDRLVSGSWLVGGALTTRVTAVGPDSFAARLVADARRFSLTGSELMESINRVLRWLSLMMVVIGPILLWRQLQIDDWRRAVRATTAGLVGMIPEGLVLLTTLAFLTAAVRLGQRR
ncbi:MAG: HAD-IC family P-type ATPase, partial [Acidimicrobiaceae bacterium]|nr:HAD-IC family P-type ATPase [Acidimicrobiaceae bacterium]